MLVNEYRIGVNDYREASDSLGDKSDDNDDDSDESYEDDHRPRRSHHHWEGQYDFVCSHLVYNCHYQAVWRLPYMLLTTRGGTFLTLVLILTMMLGVPVLLLEASVGQLTRSGKLSDWSIF